MVTAKLKIMPLKQTLHHINQLWLRYEYKHTTVALLAAALFVALLDSTVVAGLLSLVKQLGYFGAFLAGLLSVSFFTTAPAIVMLIDLANELDPIALAIVAGAGAMVGDWLLMMFFEDRVIRELKPLLRKLHIHQMVARLRYKYTSWILVVAGAISLATPIPDEIGVALLGISHFNKAYLLGVCFVLNTIGLLAIVLTARALT